MALANTVVSRHNRYSHEVDNYTPPHLYQRAEQRAQRRLSNKNGGFPSFEGGKPARSCLGRTCRRPTWARRRALHGMRAAGMCTATTGGTTTTACWRPSRGRQQARDSWCWAVTVVLHALRLSCTGPHEHEPELALCSRTDASQDTFRLLCRRAGQAGAHHGAGGRRAVGLPRGAQPHAGAMFGLSLLSRCCGAQWPGCD